MDKVWISALIGALTGGLLSTSCVLFLAAPLWALLVVYPVVGAVTTGAIYAIWHHLETDTDNSHAMAEGFVSADHLIK